MVYVWYFQKCDGKPELKIGGDGNFEHMQKCIDEILDEENEQQPIKETMTNLNINSEILTQISESVSDDLGKLMSSILFIYL